MKYRKLDANGDYTLGTGSDFHANSPETVGQAAKTRLLLFTGEWFLDLLEGTPWRTEILGKYTQKTYDTVIKQRLLTTPGLNAIVDYTSSFDGDSRRLTISATLDTIYGVAVLADTLDFSILG